MHEALRLGNQSAAGISGGLQEISCGGVARGARHDPWLQYSELFHLSQRRLSLWIFRISRNGLCSGHGENGGGPQNPGMVGDYDADAAASGHACARRVVGEYGRSFSLRLI